MGKGWLIIEKKILNKLKDKNGAATSVEYVMYFVLTVCLALIFLQITLCSFTLFSFNVASNNVARSVSLQGGFDAYYGEYLYDMTEKNLGNKIKPDSMVIEIENSEGYNNVTLTSDNKAQDYMVDYPDTFVVNVRAKVPFVNLGNGKGLIYIDLGSSSSGVSEQYHKWGGLNDVS